MGLEFTGIYDFFSFTLSAGMHQHGNAFLCARCTDACPVKGALVYGKGH